MQEMCIFGIISKKLTAMSVRFERLGQDAYFDYEDTQQASTFPVLKGTN